MINSVLSVPWNHQFLSLSYMLIKLIWLQTLTINNCYCHLSLTCGPNFFLIQHNVYLLFRLNRALRVWIVNYQLPDVHGARVVHLIVDYWIINDTRLPLVFMDQYADHTMAGSPTSPSSIKEVISRFYYCFKDYFSSSLVLAINCYMYIMPVWA